MHCVLDICNISTAAVNRELLRFSYVIVTLLAVHHKMACALLTIHHSNLLFNTDWCISRKKQFPAAADEKVSTRVLDIVRQRVRCNVSRIRGT